MNVSSGLGRIRISKNKYMIKEEMEGTREGQEGVMRARGKTKKKKTREEVKTKHQETSTS